MVGTFISLIKNVQQIIFAASLVLLYILLQLWKLSPGEVSVHHNLQLRNVDSWDLHGILLSV